MTWRLRFAAPTAFLLGTWTGEALWAQESARAPSVALPPPAAAHSAAPGPVPVVMPVDPQAATYPQTGLPAAEAPPTAEPSGQPTTEELAPWWNDLVTRPLDPERNPVSLELESSVLGMLMFSPQVRVAADFPVARRTQIDDAASRFDPRAFVDSKWTDTSDPVGNLLTTGGASRYIDHTFTTSGGVRKTFTTGGQLEASQKFGYQDNNSNFFIPKNQGTARFTLNYTHPLLNGRGRVYNTSVICLAELNAQTADAQLLRDLQSVLMDLHKAYWDLRLQRAALLQRTRLKQSAVDIQNELRGRADFDVVQSQLVRANAAVATRDAAVIRFTTEVANAETRLRALINDPALAAQGHELIPIQSPFHQGAETDLVGSLTVALENRPEIKQGFADIKAAGVRAEVSKNELLPVFNLLLGTYVYGLQGETKVGDAWVDQFSNGRPTYWTGLQFEYPLFNRGANARLTQRRIELRQATNRLNQTMIQVRAETETAVREVNTTYREMVSRYHATQADRTEIEYLTSRWRLAADDQQIAGVVLNDLLSAQERLAQAEYDFASAEAAYNIALANLNAVTGTLLMAEGVQIQPTVIDGVPALGISTVPLFSDGAAPAAQAWPHPPGTQPPAPQPPDIRPPDIRPFEPQRPIPARESMSQGNGLIQTTPGGGPSLGSMLGPARLAGGQGAGGQGAGVPGDGGLDVTAPYPVVPVGQVPVAGGSTTGRGFPAEFSAPAARGASPTAAVGPPGAPANR